MGSAARLAVFACTASFAAVACGDSEEPPARTPTAAPEVTLTAEEKDAWAPLPPDRSAIPVLLYHGIGPESDFSNADDAAYGVDVDDFAKQMTLIAHAGYETIDLETFAAFVRGEQVELPPRPLLLTFDDARADSWTGADAVLEQLGFNAVMFVDVGRVEGGDPEYLTWDELARLDPGWWQLQLHSGEGHQQIEYAPDQYGPFYTYREQDEDFEGWRERVRSDIAWGQDTLADHVSDYEPLAFAPPYGNYGQDGNNDPRIPDDLLSFLTDRYELVFTQDVNARATPGGGPPKGRIQVTRTMTGGELRERLLSG
jgi:peptidoglycan/xylan/chitin deacetylase (PgdA/CDA1 family)